MTTTTTSMADGEATMLTRLDKLADGEATMLTRLDKLADGKTMILMRLDKLEEEFRKFREDSAEDRKERDEERKQRNEEKKKKEDERIRMYNSWVEGDYVDWLMIYARIHKGKEAHNQQHQKQAAIKYSDAMIITHLKKVE